MKDPPGLLSQFPILKLHYYISVPLAFGGVL